MANSTDIAPTPLQSLDRPARRKQPSKFLFIRALADVPEKYEEIFSIDKIEYVTQAIGLAALFNGAIDNATGRFSSAEARKIIEAYNRDLPTDQANYKLGIFNVLQTSLTQTNAVVSGMVDKVLAALKDAIGVALGTTTTAQLTSAITDAFTDLKSQEGDAWIFWQKRTAEKTTYSYAILFAVQDNMTGRFLVCLPMSLEIEVDIAYEKVLWITIQDRETYSVKLDAMKVGQLLYPSTPVAQYTEHAVSRAKLEASGGPDGGRVLDLKVSSVVVWNGTKKTQYATALNGQYSTTGSLSQLMAWPGVVHTPMDEGSTYLVSFVMDGKTENRWMIYNGDVGDPGNPTLWFVSQ